MYTSILQTDKQRLLPSDWAQPIRIDGGRPGAD
jgi:hypothetical protein